MGGLKLNQQLKEIETEDPPLEENSQPVDKEELPLEEKGGPLDYLYRKIFHPILTIKDSPEAIAGGFSLGILAGCTPMVGLQMIVVVFIGTFIRVNRIAAVTMVWISNPLTFVPLYYFNYRVGLILLGRKVITYGQFKELLPFHADGIVDGVQRIFTLGMEIAVPLWCGSLITGLALAIPSYFIILFLVKRHRDLKIKVLQGEEGRV